jgi:hypothetical protein
LRWYRWFPPHPSLLLRYASSSVKIAAPLLPSLLFLSARFLVVRPSRSPDLCGGYSPCLLLI